MNYSTHLLACDVFASELATLLETAMPVRYLEMGLHDRPDELRQCVGDEIQIIESEPAVKTILLAYGLCGNALSGVVAGRCQLILPRAHDCISILLGSSRRHEAILRKNAHTYFYSPGWIRGKRVPGPDRESALREFYAERYGDDPEMLEELIDADREVFEKYDTAAYIDILNDQKSRDYCRLCAASKGWSFKELKGDPSFLRELVNGPWSDQRFLVVPPGNRIDVDADGNLLTREQK